MRDKNKVKKGSQPGPMSQLLPSQEGEKRRNNKKKVGEKERWRFCFGLAHSFFFFFFF